MLKRRRLPYNTCIGKEDVKPAVPLHGIVNNSLDLGLVGSIKLPRMDVHSGKFSVDLLLVRLQMSPIKIADVDGPGTALGVLVGCGSADTQE